MTTKLIHLYIAHLLEVYFHSCSGLDYDLDREEIQASYEVLQPQYNLGTPGQLVIPGSESISHWNLQLDIYTLCSYCLRQNPRKITWKYVSSWSFRYWWLLQEKLTLILWIPSVATSGAPQFLGSLFCFRSGDHKLLLKFGGDLLKYTPLRITSV